MSIKRTFWGVIGRSWSWSWSTISLMAICDIKMMVKTPWNYDFRGHLIITPDLAVNAIFLSFIFWLFNKFKRSMNNQIQSKMKKNTIISKSWFWLKFWWRDKFKRLINKASQARVMIKLSLAGVFELETVWLLLFILPHKGVSYLSIKPLLYYLSWARDNYQPPIWSPFWAE